MAKKEISPNAAAKFTWQEGDIIIKKAKKPSNMKKLVKYLRDNKFNGK